MSWQVLRPLGNNVLVKLDTQRTHYGSGAIETPDYYREQQVLATVVAVGRGVMQSGGLLHRVMLEPGDRVLLGKYNGVELPPPDHDAEGSYWVCDCSYLFKRPGPREPFREADIYAQVVEG